MATTPQSAPGLGAELRSLHWSVKLILAILALSFGSPLLVAVGLAAVGPVGGYIGFGGALFAAGWFLFTSPSSGTRDPARETGSLWRVVERAM